MLTADRETLIRAETERPFTGYLVISDSLMQSDGFADFLFDNFEMVADITTVLHECDHETRLLMRSVLFTSGFGQYEMDIEVGRDGYRSITTLKFIST